MKYSFKLIKYNYDQIRHAELKASIIVSIYSIFFTVAYTIDILDAKIINIGIDFTLISNLEANKFEVLNEAIAELESYYNKKFEIGQPFYVSDIYSRLNKLNDVIDDTRVDIVQKLGSNYSNEPVNIRDLYSAGWEDS